MQIVKVTMNEERLYVPVRGLEGVVDAITSFSNGYTPGARAAQNDVAATIEKDSGPFALGVYLLASLDVSASNSIADELLREAEHALKDGKEYSRSYDYDAFGTPFIKTSVRIKPFGDDMYGISICGAYVGNAPEVGLAEHLGTPRALLSCSIEVETEPVEYNRFAFDFEQVLRRLDPVLNTRKIKGKTVASAMMEKDAHGYHRASFVFYERAGLRVRIVPGHIEYNDASTGQGDWTVSGSVFTGKLRRDRTTNDENAMAAPTFRVIVMPSELSNSGFYPEPMPLWQLNRQQELIDLSNQIASALR